MAGLAPAGLAKDTCAHCGKQQAAMKHCANCKQASYCGAECQKAAWKGHKKTCLSRRQVFEKVRVAACSGNWREVLKWDGRVDELVENQEDDEARDNLLQIFKEAHKSAMNSAGSTSHHLLSYARLQKLRIELLGKLQRFRDQGECMVNLANHILEDDDRKQEAVRYYEQARAVGAGRARDRGGGAAAARVVGGALHGARLREVRAGRVGSVGRGALQAGAAGGGGTAGPAL